MLFKMYILHLYVWSIVSRCKSYRILVAFTFPTKSHRTLGDVFVNTLLEAGHEVTYITAYPEKRQLLSANLTQIDVGDTVHNITWPVKSVKEDGISQRNDYRHLYMILSFMHDIARATVTNENVQRLLLDPNRRFDLMVAEWMFNELYAGFSAVYQCPLIWFSTMEPHWMVLRLAQLTWNPEFHANIYTKNVQLPLSFPQRLQEFVNQMETSAMKTFIFHSNASKDYKKIFVPIISKRRLDVPTYEDVAMNASLVMINSHVALAPAVSLPPNCVGVGGYHIDNNVKTLPEDLQKIMDDATDGVIYFSMGSYVSGSKWPQDLIRDLLELFGNLNQTVLWKLDKVSSGSPDNVHILPWAPQQSILKHPNCRIFITHGGILSTTEAVHFGVPVIGLPVFADQFANTANAEKKGFGKSIHLSSGLVGDLKVAIQEVIGNSKYKEKAKLFSHIYHDQTSPRKRMVAWVEYVVRTRGATHLRSPALLLPWYQQWYLDILFPSFTAVIVLYFITVTSINKMYLS